MVVELFFKKKVCSTCLAEKSASEFSKLTRAADGLQYNCKVCNKKYRDDHIEEARAYDRAWYKKHPERAYAQKLKRYGLTLEQYWEMVRLRDGKCDICKKKRRLCVDHDHVTKVVRGLLCKSCNGAIGALGDTKEGVFRALQYLGDGNDGR